LATTPERVPRAPVPERLGPSTGSAARPAHSYGLSERSRRPP